MYSFFNVKAQKIIIDLKTYSILAYL